MLCGFINVYKEAGMTSHSVVSAIRRILGMKRVGHTGTLDPMATGVLPICIGSATKAAFMAEKSDKIYRAKFLFGIKTDTGDCTGKVIERNDKIPSEEELLSATQCFIGEISQIPPMYSAVKKEGRKLYELARQGIVISREPRTIKVSKIDILSFQDNEVEIRIACSKGTYVRTLGEDLAENIGAVCTMTSLLREKSGIFSIEDAKTLKEIEEIFRSDKIGTIIINTDTVFLNLPEVFLPEDECKKYKNGLKFLPQGIKCDIPFRVYGPDGEFVAIAELKEDLGEKIIRPVKNFF